MIDSDKADDRESTIYFTFYPIDWTVNHYVIAVQQIVGWSMNYDSQTIIIFLYVVIYKQLNLQWRND